MESNAPEATGRPAGAAAEAHLPFLRLLPAWLGLLLLGAHFLRAGRLGMVVVVLALLALPAFRRPWASFLLQCALAVGAIEWLWTIVVLARVRAAAGEPYTRMAAILGGVALFTALSAFTLGGAPVRRWFRTER